MPRFLESNQAFDRFLEAFETGTHPRAEWTHTAHVAAAAGYLLENPYPEALLRIRRGIQHYNACQGIANTPDNGYHETLTRFWTAIIHATLGRCDPALPRLEKVRFAVEELGPRRDLLRSYYSFDVVRSREARGKWIAPDLLSLSEPS